MNWLILPQARVEELDLINSQHEDRNISPVLTTDSILLVGADLIGDLFWSDYQDFLISLVRYNKQPIFSDTF
jgi:hypothetical protein